jgi:hypothetical protein
MSLSKCPYLWKVKSYSIRIDKLRQFDFSPYVPYFTDYKSLEERLEIDFRSAFNPEYDILINNIDFEFVNIINQEKINATLNDQVLPAAGQMMRVHLEKNKFNISKKLQEMIKHWQERKARKAVIDTQTKEEDMNLLLNEKKRKLIEMSNEDGH